MDFEATCLPVLCKPKSLGLFLIPVAGCDCSLLLDAGDTLPLIKRPVGP